MAVNGKVLSVAIVLLCGLWQCELLRRAKPPGARACWPSRTMD